MLLSGCTQDLPPLPAVIYIIATILKCVNVIQYRKHEMYSMVSKPKRERHGQCRIMARRCAKHMQQKNLLFKACVHRIKKKKHFISSEYFEWVLLFLRLL